MGTRRDRGEVRFPLFAELVCRMSRPKKTGKMCASFPSVWELLSRCICAQKPAFLPSFCKVLLLPFLGQIKESISPEPFFLFDGFSLLAYSLRVSLGPALEMLEMLEMTFLWDASVAAIVSHQIGVQQVRGMLGMPGMLGMLFEEPVSKCSFRLILASAFLSAWR